MRNFSRKQILGSSQQIILSVVVLSGVGLFRSTDGLAIEGAVPNSPPKSEAARISRQLSSDGTERSQEASPPSEHTGSLRPEPEQQSNIPPHSTEDPVIGGLGPGEAFRWEKYHRPPFSSFKYSPKYVPANKKASGSTGKDTESRMTQVMDA